MTTAKSPLGFPERIGSATRFISSALVIVLSVWGLCATIRGISLGVLVTPSHHHPGYLSEAADPLRFWVLAITYCAIAAWAITASIREIFYTLHREK
jgi:hypothetical protein